MTLQSPATPKEDSNVVILLIEDDEVDAMAFTRMVAAQQLPYRVHSAGTLAAARRLLATQVFDIVLADHDLPDGTAIDLLGGGLDTPIIVITGAGNQEMAVAALRAGARDYLIKSAERTYLVVLPHRIKQVLDVVRAERLRHQSEASYRDLVEEMNDLVQSVTPGGRILFVNRAWRETLGYTSEEVAALNVFDVIDPADHAHCRAALQRLAAGEKIGPVEMTYRAKDGRAVAVEGRVNMRFVDGRAESTRGIFHDISERKKAEAALSRAKERLELALNASQQVLWDCDLTTGTMHLSQSWSATTETAPEASYSYSMTELEQWVHPDDVAPLRAEIIATAKGTNRPFSLDMRIRTASGEWKWIHAEGKVTLRDANGRALRATGTNADIDARKRAAEKARAAEQQLRDMTNGVPGAVYQFQLVNGLQPRVIFMSEGAEALCGLSHERIEREPNLLFSVVVEEDRADIVASLKESTATKARHWAKEFRIRRTDGAIRWTRCEANRYGRGVDSVWYGYWVDITTQREAEENLRKAMAAAEAANRAKSRFLATTSHEIRTPMNAILGMLELLGHTRLDTEQTKLVGMSRHATDSLLAIVNDMLDLSKIEAGQLAIQPTPGSLAALINAVNATFFANASAKGVSLTKHVEPAIAPTLVFDTQRVRQVLLNLVSNAVKFTERGRIEVRAALLNGDAATQSIRIDVEDSGIGVSQEDQAALFQPFVQVGTNTNQRYGGTGLGLAISKQLTELMGGSLTMASTPGRGTTMTVTLALPVAKEAPIAAARFSDQPATPTKGLKILVADDNDVNLFVLESQLKSLGHRIDLAHDGRQALARWRAGHYDVVICDGQMPEMDGYAFAKAVRAAEKNRTEGTRIPIIAYTASAMKGEAEAFYAAGMDDILTKPVSLEALSRALSTWSRHGDSARAAPSSPPPEMKGRLYYIADAPVDHAKLKQITDGDAELERQLLALVRAKHRNEMALLQAAMQSEDLRAMAQLAHRIKGTARTVAAQALSSVCEQIEKAAASGERTEALRAKPDLERESGRLATYLESLDL
jgi:PAS domain S-box-containing protein